MMYGSLYKVFLKLSKKKEKHIMKNQYNELIIPKIFDIILLKKEISKKNIKNGYLYNYQTQSNISKSKENKSHSLIKNYFINDIDYLLPKIKGKKEIKKDKNDLLINNALKFLKINDNKSSSSINNSSPFYKIQSDDNNNKNIKKEEEIKSDLKYKYIRNKFNDYDNNKDIDKEIDKILRNNNTFLNNKRNKLNIIAKNNSKFNYLKRNKGQIFEQYDFYKNENNKLKLSKIIFKEEKDNTITNNSINQDIKIRSKTIFKFNKVYNNSLISLLTMTKQNNYTKLEAWEKTLSKKELNFPLYKNIFNISDIFYFKLSKMYKAQFKEYMSHRINWVLINSKKEISDTEIINFEWKYYSNKLNYNEYKYDSSVPLKKLKMVNLFEKNYEIGNKKKMFINLINYCDENNINAFEIVPFTILIGNSSNIKSNLNKIKEIMKFVENNKSNKNNDIISKQKYNDIFNEDKFFSKLKNHYIFINKNFISEKNYWIIKPPDLYQGKCIEICNSYHDLVKKSQKIFKGVNKKIIPNQLTTLSNNEINEEEKILSLDYSFINNNTFNNIRKKINSKMYCSNDIIIQKYLDNPLLYKNRKFDLRCFVLLDSNMNLFFCKEGHLKLSSELYNLNNTNKYIHITNYSLQKNSNNFQLYEIGNEVSYKEFKDYLIKEKISLDKFSDMINQMKLMIKISFKSFWNKIFNQKKENILCFEIFGYDFILDKDFKLWILEINNNPGLSISSPVIEKLIPRMIDDAFRLTIDKVFNTKYDKSCIDEKGRYKTKYKLDGYKDDENIFEFLCNLS